MDQNFDIERTINLFAAFFEVLDTLKLQKIFKLITNLLLYDVIPGIIAQVLVSDGHDKALEFAKQIHKIHGITREIEGFPMNAPNYFEFIMVHAPARKLAKYQDLLSKVQATKSVDLKLLWGCFRIFSDEFPFHDLNKFFNFETFADPIIWQEDNALRCKLLTSRYTQGFSLMSEPKFYVEYLTTEDASDLLKLDGSGDDDDFHPFDFDDVDIDNIVIDEPDDIIV
ncbi:hypothetical protein H4R35_002266 [Dimargaris xerosporica]|nr:hypothetical protein H4R35_002266 [Dimargaris xerosporica]